MNLGPNGIYSILDGGDWTQNLRTSHLAAAVLWGLAGGWFAAVVGRPRESADQRAWSR